jgi:hypothetical protein
MRFFGGLALRLESRSRPTTDGAQGEPLNLSSRAEVRACERQRVRAHESRGVLATDGRALRERSERVLARLAR